MLENENLATEQVAENAENTAEQTPQKLFTQEEVNEFVSKRNARTEAKIRKEYQRKYGDLEEVLKAGTGKDNLDEMTDTFRSFYQSKGINIPKKPTYSNADIEVLAQAEANEIINMGFEDVVAEVDRLADIGADRMTQREKAVFTKLYEYRKSTEQNNELSQIGVTEDVYNSNEFKEFASKFNAGTPVRDIYDIYSKTQPKKDIKPMGSIRNSISGDSGVKDFYTRDEALKFTKKDFDENPALYKAVESSMLKWK